MRRNWLRIVNLVEPAHILDHLYEKEIVDFDELSELRNTNNSRFSRCVDLMKRVMPRRGGVRELATALINRMNAKWEYGHLACDLLPNGALHDEFVNRIENM